MIESTPATATSICSLYNGMVMIHQWVLSASYRQADLVKYSFTKERWEDPRRRCCCPTIRKAITFLEQFRTFDNVTIGSVALGVSDIHQSWVTNAIGEQCRWQRALNSLWFLNFAHWYLSPVDRYNLSLHPGTYSNNCSVGGLGLVECSCHQAFGRYAY
jgi:hypothetical protein